MLDLTALERQVLDKLLAGDGPVLAALRRQAEDLKVQSRRFTGVAFFADFEINPDTPPVANPSNFEIGDVNGAAENVNHGMGFLLFVRSGALSTLEGYTYHDPWPEDLRGLVLT
jgi:hypothetical protein